MLSANDERTWLLRYNNSHHKLWRIREVDQLAGLMGSRRNEDIALDMMKFIAATTGYGKTGSPGAGFQGGTVNKPEDYATHLLDLYTRCLNTINGKR